MQTAKNHLINILSSTHDNLPLCLWCYLLEQEEITFNLIRTLIIHPYLSANYSLHGAFNCSITPLATPVIKVIAYNSAETRESWSKPVKLVHCVGPSMHHCRCYRIYVPSTRKIIITDTLKCTEDDLFEVPFKFKEDTLYDTVDDLKSMIFSESSLQSHTNNPRVKAIDKLHELILKPTKPAKITSPAQRVKVNNHNVKLPRVPVT